MEIIRDEERIDRMKKRSQQATLVGFLFLIGGFILVFFTENQNVILFQMLALLAGWILSQIGIYLAHRYARSPRPDEVLDEALKPVARQGRIYHYVLPAPHVLLAPAGPIVFNLKYQSGDISVYDDKWRQKGIGFRRFFGQEGLGNPARETEKMIGALANYIRENAPEVVEVPIGAMIVFTSKDIKNLDVDGSSIPAMHYSKVKGYLKQKGLGKSLRKRDYDSILAAFDMKADGLI